MNKIMRENKFRAWIKEYKVIVYVDFIDFIEREITVIDDEGIQRNFSFEDIELRQYTGLKDKNGTEIYEGDILRGYDGSDDKIGEIFVVEWSDFYTGFYPLNSDLIMVNGDTFEVIGNIYEHPNLLN